MSPSNEYSGSISFKIDWFDLFAVQGTLKSLLQHHNSKASVLQYSAFFMVQLSHLYKTTGKTIGLTIQTFVRKDISLLFIMQSRYVRAFPPSGEEEAPSSKEQVSFNFMAAVTICSAFGAPQIRSVTSPSEILYTYL